MSYNALNNEKTYVYLVFRPNPANKSDLEVFCISPSFEEAKAMAKAYAGKVASNLEKRSECLWQVNAKNGKIPAAILKYEEKKLAK